MFLSRTKQKEANVKYFDVIYRIQIGPELRKAGVNILGKSENSSNTVLSDTKNSSNMLKINLMFYYMNSTRVYLKGMLMYLFRNATKIFHLLETLPAYTCWLFANI